MEVLALERTLTELDPVLLLSPVRRDRARVGVSTPRPAIAPLLAACAIVPPRQLPPDVVTLSSPVPLQDLGLGQRSTLTLRHPADAGPAAGFVSVPSPAGASLPGRTVGSAARWSPPAGDERAPSSWPSSSCPRPAATP